MKDTLQNARQARWAGHPGPVTLKCCICGALFKVTYSRRESAKYCNYRCHQIGEGRKGGAIIGDRMKALSRGLAYKKTGGRHTHRVIAEKIIGRSLMRGEIVHHKDGNKLNNETSNIEVLSSQGQHMARHRAQMQAARKNKHGY